MTQVYPIALLLEKRPCLVVGGGRVAERKVESLLAAGAQVTVVATRATEAITAWAEAGRIALHLRPYAPDDLQDALVVIVATDDAELNARISAECHQRGTLVNVVDQPALCNFYVPAVVERGPISIAISTGGASPALARDLRKLVERTIGEEYGLLAGLMSELRGEVIAAHERQEDRAAAWNRLLESDVLDMLRRGETDRARGQARETMGLPPGP